MRLLVDVRPIMAFMRQHYTDERLAMLRAHAEDGKLAFFSCCCFIGVATADHPLHGKHDGVPFGRHYRAAQALSDVQSAERAAGALWRTSGGPFLAYADQGFRARLLPLILWEQCRRDRLHVQPESVQEFVGSLCDGR